MRTTPGCPAAARPQPCSRPSATTSAPSAMALRMSLPRWTPPSTMIRARPSTACGDLGQRVQAAQAVVDLAAAVVGHPDVVDAVLDGDFGVLGGLHAFEHERQAGQVS